MIVLIILGGLLIAYGGYQLLRALWKMAVAIYYWNFAKGKNLDRGFEKHVIKKSQDYKSFESNFDKSFKDGI